MPQNWMSSTQQVITNRPGANMPSFWRRSMATWALKVTVLPVYFSGSSVMSRYQRAKSSSLI